MSDRAPVRGFSFAASEEELTDLRRRIAARLQALPQFIRSLR